jgi:hypothetical protein
VYNFIGVDIGYLVGLKLDYAGIINYPFVDQTFLLIQAKEVLGHLPIS